jgi:hypothetical protein
VKNLFRPATDLNYSTETKQFEKLTDYGWAPVWLSDSRRLLFPYQDKIYLADKDSKKVREVLSVNPYTIFSWRLNVSKDNGTIYYSLEMNEADIWLLDASSVKPGPPRL